MHIEGLRDDVGDAVEESTRVEFSGREVPRWSSGPVFGVLPVTAVASLFVDMAMVGSLHGEASERDLRACTSCSLVHLRFFMGEYSYCELCKSNHNQGKRHVYAKKHQTQVSAVIDRQRAKLKRFKAGLTEPQRVSITEQPSTWCIFCNADIRPDVAKDIQYFGAHVLEHLASKDHRQNIEEWWRMYNAEKTAKGEFVITDTALTKFRKKTRDANKVLYREDEAKLVLKDAESKTAAMATGNSDSLLTEGTDHENEAYETVVNQYGVVQNPTGLHEGRRVWGGGIIKYKKEGQWLPWPIDLDDEKPDHSTTYMGGWTTPNWQNIPTTVTPKTESLIGNRLGSKSNEFIPSSLSSAGDLHNELNMFPPMLTRIEIHSGPCEGNVHMPDSVPPWLQDEVAAKSTEVEVGPSMDDFLAAKNLERKKKLNPNRLGADFDRAASSHRDWLPSFGRIWNSGPRSASRREYLMEKKK